MRDFKATYYIEDGYVGADRPQHTTIPRSEIEDDMNEDQLIQVFHEWIYTDMLEKISTCGDHGEFVEWAKKVLAEREYNE